MKITIEKEKDNGNNMLHALRIHEGYKWIIVDLVVGCLPFCQSLLCFFNYVSEKESFDYHWISLFMVFNGCAFFFISFLHSFYGKWYRYGKTLGCFWGVTACVICLVLAKSCSYDCPVYDVFGIPLSIHLVIQGIYSIVITISSYILSKL